MSKKERRRKCIHCSYCKRIDDPKYIGVCQRYERFVLDALCGCEHTKDGFAILFNFERPTGNAQM